MIDKNKARNEIFSTFKQSGFQEQLKKHLRVQIVEKLKEKNLLSNQNDKQKKGSKLYHRVLTSLISQQLSYSDCGYTKSIYVVQAGFQDNMLSRSQLVQILNIGNCQLDQQMSILSNVMKRQYPFNMSTVQTSSVQTNPQQIGYTIEQRLLFIDQQYRRSLSKHQGEADKFTTLKLQKIQQIQLELKKQYERDMQRFKEFQIHRVKTQVGQHWRKKYQQYAKGIQEEYQRKLDNVRKREKMLEEDFVKRNKTLEQKTGAVQANLKQKIELLDLKSITIQKQLENMAQSTKNSQKQIRNQEVQLRQKIRKYDDLLLDVNKKIEYQTNVARLSIQQEYQQKEMQLIQRKKFVDQQYGKLMSIKDTCEVIERDNKRVHQENQQLRKTLSTIQKDYHNAVNDLAAKGQRIQLLKQQIFEQKGKCKNISDNLKENERKVKALQKQILGMRKELQQLRITNERYERQKDQQRQRENIDQNIEQEPRNFSQIATKFDVLKNKRRKDIQKFLLQGN